MFFTIKLYLHLNCVLILNWIVWNRTIFIKMDLALNDHKTKTTKPNLMSKPFLQKNSRVTSEPFDRMIRSIYIYNIIGKKELNRPSFGYSRFISADHCYKPPTSSNSSHMMAVRNCGQLKRIYNSQMKVSWVSFQFGPNDIHKFVY